MKSILKREARVTLFAGHYGSGKSTAAIAFAAALRAAFPDEPLALADLDIVNPYFRTTDSAELLRSLGVEMVASDFAGTNVDVPALPGAAYSITERRDVRAVIDVGGDDRGALALGRYVPALKEEGSYDMLAVISPYRPLTRTVADTVEVLREIEAACGLAFTAILNNPALGANSTADSVVAATPYALGVAEAMGIPVAFTMAREDICDELKKRSSELPAEGLLLPFSHKIAHGGIVNG